VKKIIKHNMGRTNFAETYGLGEPDQEKYIQEVQKQIDKHNLEVVRLSFPDQHGILRGKSIVPEEVPQAIRNGCTCVTTLLAKDTSHKTVFPVFQEGGGLNLTEMSNAGDFIMLPLPHTFKILPWAPKIGWMLCDIYFSNGETIPFSTRSILKNQLQRLEKKKMGYLVGLEVEFHVYKLKDPMLNPADATQPPTPPEVELLAHGFNYLTELRLDEFEEVLGLIRSNLKGLNLPLRSFEVEFGPSQFEITFQPMPALEASDKMMLFKNAVKQICRRHGYHATFMCRPGLENSFSSGWHLHQSLYSLKDGGNALAPKSSKEELSKVGANFLAGLLEHAKASNLFTTPTINGYKRYKPNSLAPNRIVWGKDNKGAMLRLVGAGTNDPATRIENRVGEPAANPYLYMASQLVSGIDGIDKKLSPPAPTEDPYTAEAELLPKTILEAAEELSKSSLYREVLGDQFIDYILAIKYAEIERFFSEVTDWEHKEYFEIF